MLHRCIPKDFLNSTANFAKDELNARSVSTQIFSDVYEAWYWILGAAGLAIVLGFVWLLLMRFFSGIIVWLTIIAVYILIVGFTVFLFWRGKLCKVSLTYHYSADVMQQAIDNTPEQERVDTDQRNQNVVQAFSYIFIVISVIMLILLIWMRNRIRLAIGIIKEASKAIGSMPFIIAFPGCIFILIAMFTVYWLVIALYALK